MTNTKLAILESGYASIRQIERPAERRLALQELQKEMKVSPTEFQKLIHELTIEADTTNDELGTFDQIMQADIEQEVLVDRLIMSGTVAMVASEVGCGKSSLFYQIMESVSTGNPLFGKLKAKKGKVAVVQVDETFINAKTKFKAMDLKPDNNNVKFFWKWSPSQMPELEELIKSNNYDLVLMDSFGKLFGEAAGDMNTAEAGFFMYELNSIAAKTGAAFFITHHLKKEQGKTNRKNDAPRIPTLGDFFGSGYITAGVRDAWGLWQKGEDLDGTPMFGMKYLKDNSGLIEKGWVMNLDGCLESKRHSLSGGAGGLVWKESLSISTGAHTVTVGNGGTGTAAGASSSSNQGQDSLFGSYITAKGGGYGGSSSGNHGTDGGSGGGAGRNYGGGGSNPGSATQPSQSGNSAGLGNAGGAGRADSEGPGGGGGGAGGAGGAGSSGTVGNGGVGSSTFIGSSAAATTAFLLGTTSGTDSSNAATTGSSSGTLYIAGGGSGGTQDRSEHNSGGNGGLGGGAAIGGSSNGTNGLANTGGGGSGTTSGSGTGGNGGSGLVIIRYTSTTFQQAGQNLTLQSQAVTANSQPSSADLIILARNNEGTATINTDIKGYVSRDNGSTYTQGTLVDEGTYDTNVKILAVHDLDISSQPSGTQMRYKIETLNQSNGSKETFIQAVSLGWK